MKINEEIVKWLMDVSKYVVTAVVISSFLTGLKEVWMIYVLGLLISGMAFGGALLYARYLKINQKN